jgi:hypothetical protein
MDWTTEPANPAMQKWRVSAMTVLWSEFAPKESPQDDERHQGIETISTRVLVNIGN